MVVCKFFMEGYCKFGVRCKFDHVDPYSGYDSQRSSDYSPERPQGTSILKASSTSFGRQEFAPSPPQHGFGQSQQQVFGQSGFSQTLQQSFSQTPQHSFSQTPQQGYNTPQQSSFAQKPPGLKYNVQEMMQIVLRDIAQLEKGSQWQLSCYSPLKELPNIPGLEDYSPEELRWECYKALQNGSLPLCQVIVQQLFGNVAKINNELKRKDTGYSIIDRWLRNSEQQAQNTSEQPASPFVSSFGGSNVSSSAFSTPFFAPNEPQIQTSIQSQPVSSSFSFSLSPQQQPLNSQPFQSTSPAFTSNQSSAFVSHSVSPFSPQLRTPAPDNQAYSSIEALSETDLKAFQADRFVLGSIPTKPPPREFCNV